MSAALSGEAFALLAVAALAAGLSRGFSGFGAAMIFMPAAAAVLDPPAAVITLFVIDAIATAPLVASAVGGQGWRAITPLALGAVVGAPLGALALREVDPTALRWAFSLMALGVVVVFLSGWRYRRAPGRALSVAVGSASGFLGGLSGFTGPPVVLFYLGGPERAAAVRANLIRFFLFTTLAAGVSYAAFGLFERGVVLDALWLAPLYVGGALLGARLFGFASEATFRALAYGMITVSAVASLPLFDASGAA